MTSLEQEIKLIYKTELHQHVDGSIPVQVTWDLMTKYGLNPVDTIEEMRTHLVVQPEDEGAGLLAYLRKFHYPLWVTQFYDNLQVVAYEIAKEAYHKGVRVFELRYSPTIHTHAGLTPRQAITSILHGLKDAEDEFPGLVSGLVVIAMRHMGPHIAKILARQSIGEGEKYHRGAGVVGFDIAGAERGNPPGLFREAYDIAKTAGLGCTVHAGEELGPQATWDAIDVLGATRIGHACSAALDETLLRRMAADKICVEVCHTSNYQTGAVKKEEAHPIKRFLEFGVPIAICTDNTTVSNTDQIKENLIICQELDLTIDDLKKIHEDAKQFSFIGRVRDSL
tara:strand:- start:45152 stop:46165 length:1014 start_codon:yes stop_codon:yes gene_type:complete